MRSRSNAFLAAAKTRNAWKQKCRRSIPTLKDIGSHRQLNHYFEGKGDFKAVAQVLKDENTRKTCSLSSRKKRRTFRSAPAMPTGPSFSFLKASIDDTTSANGTARREFEEKVDMPLDALDKMILAAGFTYQSKWSRERTEYASPA